MTGPCSKCQSSNASLRKLIGETCTCSLCSRMRCAFNVGPDSINQIYPSSGMLTSSSTARCSARTELYPFLPDVEGVSLCPGTPRVCYILVEICCWESTLYKNPCTWNYELSSGHHLLDDDRVMSTLCNMLPVIALYQVSHRRSKPLFLVWLRCIANIIRVFFMFGSHDWKL